MAGCASTPAADLAPAAALTPSLMGTSWSLVQFQSMDDAQGTTRTDDPAMYTVDFGADGRVALRLNCNRATATYQTTLEPGAESGTLRFGPITGTRARCAPPSLDQHLLRHLPHVRGYLVRDGQLHMTLFADSGVYSWRPWRRH